MHSSLLFFFWLEKCPAEDAGGHLEVEICLIFPGNVIFFICFLFSASFNSISFAGWGDLRWSLTIGAGGRGNLFHLAAGVMIPTNEQFRCGILQLLLKCIICVNLKVFFINVFRILFPFFQSFHGIDSFKLSYLQQKL